MTAARRTTPSARVVVEVRPRCGPAAERAAAAPSETGPDRSRNPGQAVAGAATLPPRATPSRFIVGETMTAPALLELCHRLVELPDRTAFIRAAVAEVALLWRCDNA